MRHTAMKRTSALLLATGLLFGLAACSDDDSDDDAATDETSADSGDTGSDDGGDTGSAATITISGSSFDVADAAAGEPVSVSNQDGFSHTVTSDDDAFEEVRLDGGSSGEIAALDAGEYAFHCEIHRSMTGTLVVA
jgi:plastocyanin